MRRGIMLALWGVAGVLIGLAACDLAPSPNQATPGPACVSPGTSPPAGARSGFSPAYCR